MRKLKPSAQVIYQALLRGERLTPMTSLKWYGIHALSQRIGEIRRATGLDIVSERVKGGSYHVYYVDKEAA